MGGLSGGRMSQEIKGRVSDLVSPILADQGMELVDLEYRREGRGWVLRLYIDKEGGVTLEDCVRVSQEIGTTLDIEEVIETSYSLEVSSPGLNRPLKTEKDFNKYRNRLIKVKTFNPIDSRRNFKGRLRAISEGWIEMEIDGGIVTIPLANVAKANLEFEF
jgi:ribosome maturation factor RimP